MATVNSIDYTVDPKNRHVESRVETSISGVFLSLTSRHRPGGYELSVSRVKIEDGILQMKINRALFQDPAPIRRQQRAAARYSAKNLEAFHGDVLEALTAEDLAAAVSWAERY